ncbi:SDR family oxidoreductase [Paenibacillus glycanilyticus]|uniref:SDR family oxidoreductase n=1 Tax=Paenibacillus glycanilyticus TaxID=126569 RepID=UPI002040FAA4|nr:SDR family oxidoreductase [Paenibacillus glycanilyticus]MCM3630579.1 SDR family oxidoreductase [Paenibacillus glycanilyticus]
MSTSKIVLITGGNKGIGLETARQLGKLGFTILLGSRDEASGREATATLTAENIHAKAITLDITDLNTIQSTVEQIDDQYGALDVLINNAGVCFEGVLPPSQLELTVLRNTYETNVFGSFSVMKAMLPLIKKSPAGRIANLSSGLASLTEYNTPDSDAEKYGLNLLAYMSSKTAVNALTVLFAKELKDTPIKVNSADPGYTATDLNGHTGYRTVEQGAFIVVKLTTLPSDGPNGGFFDENGVIPW